MPLGQICLTVHISQLAKLFCAFPIRVVHSVHNHRAVPCSSRCPVSSAVPASWVYNLSVRQMTRIVHRQVGRTISNREVGQYFCTWNTQRIPSFL